MKIPSFFTTVHSYLSSFFDTESELHQAGKRTQVSIDPQTKKKIVTKSHQSSPGSLSYQAMCKEIDVIKVLAGNKYRGESVAVQAPTFVRSSAENNTIQLVTRYVSGTQLDTLGSKKQFEYVSSLLNFMKQTSDCAIDNNLELPFRSQWYFLLYFPVLCIRAILKFPKHTVKLLQSLDLFYLNFDYSRLNKKDKALIHRDLFGSNCIVDEKKKEITILDWESAIFADSLYEYALVNWQYQGILSKQERYKLVNDRYDTPQSLRHWQSLSFFVALHALSIEEKNSDMVRQAFELLDELLIKKTLYEHLLTLILKVISTINFLLPQSWRHHRGPLILCYHSVGNTGWRYSTPPEYFEKQIIWLKNHFTVVSLEQIVTNPQQNQIALTFDDGYQDVLTHALPIMEKYRVTGTVFVLGNPDAANRQEMENELPLLSKKNVKFLVAKGWIIGHHTQTHYGLATASAQELDQEIIQGKTQAEYYYQMPLQYFAYPKGAYSKKIIDTVKKAGFTHAFTVDDKPVAQNSNQLLIDRIAIEGEWSQSQFQAVLSPLGLWVLRILWQLLVLKDKIKRKT